MCLYNIWYFWRAELVGLSWPLLFLHLGFFVSICACLVSLLYPPYFTSGLVLGRNGRGATRNALTFFHMPFREGGICEGEGVVGIKLAPYNPGHGIMVT